MDNYLNVKLAVAQHELLANPENIRHLVCQNRMLITQSTDWWKVLITQSTDLWITINEGNVNSVQAVWQPTNCTVTLVLRTQSPDWWITI